MVFVWPNPSVTTGADGGEQVSAPITLIISVVAEIYQFYCARRVLSLREQIWMLWRPSFVSILGSCR